MDTLIWFDGELVPAAEAKVSVLTHALHYGTSVFEGVRAYATGRGVAVFRLHEHSVRLLESAKIVGMKVQLSAADIDQAVLETIRANGLDRSEEHTSELQSRGHLVCRLLLEKKKIIVTHDAYSSDVDHCS